MQFNFEPNAVFLLISALLTGIAAIFARRRSTPGSGALSLLLVFMTIWSGFYALHWLPIPSALKVLVPTATYVGVIGVPSLYLVFALNFTSHGEPFKRPILFLLAVEPLITLLLVFTNNYHHLVFRIVGDDLTRLQLQHGPWYSVNLVYSYVMISMGIIVLIYGMIRSSPLLHYQYRAILFASCIPWGLNILSEYFLGTDQLDLTPIAFGLTGILLTYAVIRNRIMNIVPVARTRIIESMSDGILVLDAQNRIVDINPAMESFLNRKPASLLGIPASEALEIWMDQDRSLLQTQESHTELKIPDSPSRYLDLRVTPLYDNGHQHLTGKLMVFRDITDRKQVEKKLLNANDRLQSQLIEIGTLQSELRLQAIHDSLTDVFNRRYLDETFDRELARAAREAYPVSVIMLDIDHFKKVNDSHGHEAGDIVLKALARTLVTHNRRGDFVCRFGGEEFVIVMPNMRIEIAFQRAQELRAALNAMQIPYGRHNLRITISMGIASYPANGSDRESVLRAADRAMYAAKQAGRDHILTYDVLETQGQITSD